MSGSSIIVRIFEAGQSTILSFPPLQAAAIIAILSFITAKAVEIITVLATEAILSRLEIEIEDELLERLHDPIYASVALGGLYIATIPLSFPPELNNLVVSTLLTLAVILWSRSLKQIGDFVAHESFNAPMDKDFIPIFQNLWVALVVLLSSFAVLKIWAINVAPFLASAGILGVIAAYAARGTIANFVGSVSLYFDNTYKKGDYVELEDGTEGTVTDIGIRSTSLRTRDGNKLNIPNAQMNSSVVLNESAPQNRRRISTQVGVPYGVDTDRVEEILKEAATDADLILETPEPNSRLEEFGNSALNYEVLCWVERARNVPQAKHHVNKQIYESLREHEIEIPYPKRDIEFSTNLQGDVNNQNPTPQSETTVEDEPSNDDGEPVED